MISICSKIKLNDVIPNMGTSLAICQGNHFPLEVLSSISLAGFLHVLALHRTAGRHCCLLADSHGKGRALKRCQATSGLFKAILHNSDILHIWTLKMCLGKSLIPCLCQKEMEIILLPEFLWAAPGITPETSRSLSVTQL